MTGTPVGERALRRRRTMTLQPPSPIAPPITVASEQNATTRRAVDRADRGEHAASRRRR